MLKRPKIKILILLISIIIIGGYFFISSLIGNPKFSNLKLLLNVEQKELIKKYIFPYKTSSQQQQTISKHQQLLKIVNLPVIELEKKREGSEIIIEESIVKLPNNKTLKKQNYHPKKKNDRVAIDFANTGHRKFPTKPRRILRHLQR